MEKEAQIEIENQQNELSKEMFKNLEEVEQYRLEKEKKIKESPDAAEALRKAEEERIKSELEILYEKKVDEAKERIEKLIKKKKN